MATKMTKIDKKAAVMYITKFAIIIMQVWGSLATEIGVSCAWFLLDVYTPGRCAGLCRG
jgi:hypothetical protein